jgi:hypothetical protein
MGQSRGCTDFIWVVALCAGLFGIARVVDYAQEHGDYRRLFHGYNYRGQLCGVDVPDQFLYYCPDQTESTKSLLSLGKPICTRQCPDQGQRVWECDGISAYQTTPAAQRYCLPVESARQAIESNERVGDLKTYAAKMGQLPQAWGVLAASAGVALVLGYVYLLTLQKCAGVFVWVCLLIVVACPSTAGSYLIWVAKFQGGFDGVPHFGNDEHNFYVGVGCAALGGVLFCVVCYAQSSVEKAIKTVKTTADCMTDCPTLMLTPLIEITSKFVVLVSMMAGFSLLVTCGSVKNGKGVYREFEYSDEQRMMLAFYVLMMLWMVELLTSLSQFAIAYAAQDWYYVAYENGRKTRVRSNGALRGYCVGLMYHLGSLALGSFLVAMLRFVRMFLEWVARMAKDRGDAMGAIIARIVGCLVWCFEQFVRFVNKNAYIEMAIKGKGFCTSAQVAVKTMVGEFLAFGMLAGATWIIQLAGIGIIASVGAMLTWMMCWNLDPFNNQASKHYVSDPVFVTGCASVICALVGLAFAVVFDTVADTMLYCIAKDAEHGGGAEREALVGTEKSEGNAPPPSEYAPPRLLELMEEQRR